MRWLIGLGFCFACFAWGTVEVKVGGYPFAPFVEKRADGGWQGLTLDLIEALNAGQSDYHFLFVPTSSANRYEALQLGRFDMMLFEDVNWGWSSERIMISPPFLFDGERYIALNKPGRDQRLFDQIDKLRLIGVKGYHYGFADFEGDPAILQQRYDILLVKDNVSIIKALLLGRGDVGIITQAYLQRYLDQHPELRKQLLISHNWDQRYQLRALIHPASRVSLPMLQHYLGELEQKGVLTKLWQAYGLSAVAVR
ncbi:substrate-binding periplasmic protein [Aeromonas schubertii]|uniref:substrate-binding periplasmic protein n=1 Tax=Aeromonas schubertii TaxID=652 RepID=UPI0010A8A08A|nr:transporter substrate-binding domain-containing protein [Aeromonas schubertii]QCG48505.1 transporter substrate-binding domain-containing protein [Aeromonas schubertii]